MIELGGNIKLEGFETLDSVELIVVKKVVGNYAKKFEEKIKFKELLVTLKKDIDFELKAKLTTEDKEIEGEATENNLFFALDKALNSISNKII